MRCDEEMGAARAAGGVVGSPEATAAALCLWALSLPPQSGRMRSITERIVMRGRFVVQTVSAVAVVFCHVCVIRCAAQSRGVAAQGSKRLRVWCVLFCERLCFGRPDDEVWSGEKGRQHMRLQKGRQRGGQKQRAVLSEVDRAHIRRVATGRRRRRDDAAQTQQEKQLKTSLRQGGGHQRLAAEQSLSQTREGRYWKRFARGWRCYGKRGPERATQCEKWWAASCVSQGVATESQNRPHLERRPPRLTPPPPAPRPPPAPTAAAGAWRRARRRRRERRRREGRRGRGRRACRGPRGRRWRRRPQRAKTRRRPRARRRRRRLWSFCVCFRATVRCEREGAHFCRPMHAPVSLRPPPQIHCSLTPRRRSPAAAAATVVVKHRAVAIVDPREQAQPQPREEAAGGDREDCRGAGQRNVDDAGERAREARVVRGKARCEQVEQSHGAAENGGENAHAGRRRRARKGPQEVGDVAGSREQQQREGGLAAAQGESRLGAPRRLLRRRCCCRLVGAGDRRWHRSAAVSSRRNRAVGLAGVHVACCCESVLYSLDQGRA